MYVVTTSRKPGRKTRRLAKVISRFFNWRYVRRGKMSIQDLHTLADSFWIISEVKGNPALLTLYKKGEETLRIGFTVSDIKKVEMDDSTVVFCGKSPLNPLVFGAIPQNIAGIKLARKFEFAKKVIVKNYVWQFTYKDIILFTMKILYIRSRSPH